MLSAVSPVSNFSTISMTYSTDYIDTYSLPGDVLIADGDGYLMKINPQTGNASRIGLTDYAIHTVESGEVLSKIAERYGLNVETIMWENNIGNANMVVSGQKLVIPPLDGISYTTVEADNLEKLAGKYDIEVDTIACPIHLVELNHLTTRKRPLDIPALAVSDLDPLRVQRINTGSDILEVVLHYDYSVAGVDADGLTLA